jgi:hypothetical protein
MGILDTQRILDTVLTDEGRRQLATGELRFSYYSFSDSAALYDHQDTLASGSFGSDDGIATTFILEASSLPQDSITLEVNDSGRLSAKEFFDEEGLRHTVSNGDIFTSGSQVPPLTPAFASLVTNLIGTSTQNFVKQRIIGSPDYREEFDDFVLSDTSVNFDILENRPIETVPQGGIPVTSLDTTPSLFADKRLSQVPNFDYLPPVNSVKYGNANIPIGRYARLRTEYDSVVSDLQEELRILVTKGYKHEIRVLESSFDNKIVGQFFEVGVGGKLTKLDVIDFGEVSFSGSVDSKRVFFVGKVFVDSRGSQTYINLFTIVLS